MPTLPTSQARPVRADSIRLGRSEAERQAALMNKPNGATTRFPGDGGRALPREDDAVRQRKG